MFNYQRVSSGNPTLNEGLKRKIHYKMKVLIGTSTINGGFNLENHMENGQWRIDRWNPLESSRGVPICHVSLPESIFGEYLDLWQEGLPMQRWGTVEDSGRQCPWLSLLPDLSTSSEKTWGGCA